MPRWVTIFRPVNHFGADQATRPTQPEPALCAGWNEYLAIAGGVNRHTRDTPARARGLAVFAECLAGGLASGDQRQLTRRGSALETRSRRYTLQMAVFALLFTLQELMNIH